MLFEILIVDTFAILPSEISISACMDTVYSSLLGSVLLGLVDIESRESLKFMMHEALAELLSIITKKNNILIET